MNAYQFLEAYVEYLDSIGCESCDQTHPDWQRLDAIHRRYWVNIEIHPHGWEIIRRIESLPIVAELPEREMVIRDGGKYLFVVNELSKPQYIAIPAAVIEELEISQERENQ